MLSAYGTEPLGTTLNVIETRIEDELKIGVTSVRPDFVDGGHPHKLHQRLVLRWRNSKRFPTRARTHAPTACSHAENLVCEVKRRKYAAGVEIRNVVHKMKKRPFSGLILAVEFVADVFHCSICKWRCHSWAGTETVAMPNETRSAAGMSRKDDPSKTRVRGS
jgi:hypothetical protein